MNANHISNKVRVKYNRKNRLHLIASQNDSNRIEKKMAYHLKLLNKLTFFNGNSCVNDTKEEFAQKCISYLFQFWKFVFPFDWQLHPTATYSFDFIVQCTVEQVCYQWNLTVLLLHVSHPHGLFLFLVRKFFLKINKALDFNSNWKYGVPWNKINADFCICG